MLISWLMRFSLVFLTLLAAIFSILRPESSSARAQGPETFTLEQYYSIYSVFSGGSSAAQNSLPASLDSELGIRIQGVFSFVFVYSHFMDPDTSNTGQLQSTQRGYGAGMRVDLPGFFFFKGKRQDSMRIGKFYPINTYMFGQAIRYEAVDLATGNRTTLTAPRYGFGMDMFLFNPHVYLSTRFSLFSYLGGTYASPSLGLGWSI